MWLDALEFEHKVKNLAKLKMLEDKMTSVNAKFI